MLSSFFSTAPVVCTQFTCINIVIVCAMLSSHLLPEVLDKAHLMGAIMHMDSGDA